MTDVNVLYDYDASGESPSVVLQFDQIEQASLAAAGTFWFVYGTRTAPDALGGAAEGVSIES